MATAALELNLLPLLLSEEANVEIGGIARVRRVEFLTEVLQRECIGQCHVILRVLTLEGDDVVPSSGYSVIRHTTIISALLLMSKA